MRIPRAVTALIARKFNIPDLAVRMFRTAAGLSGLDSSTLPVELLPLNTIQLSRGLLNFTVLQTLDGWVLPYWAEQQYDPASPSFVPRSHLGLSMNITHRNWTAAGDPACAIEPIVDPRGLLTPFPDGWSIDVWLRTDGGVLHPSRAGDVRQSLRDGLPIVETTLDHEGFTLVSTVYSSGKNAVASYRVNDREGRLRNCQIGLSVRPFNPEGVASIETIALGQNGREVTINGSSMFRCDPVPSAVFLSDRNGGDVAQRFGGGHSGTVPNRITCPSGLATALLQFDVDVPAGGTWECTIICPLEPGAATVPPSLEEVIAGWNRILEGSGQCVLPPGQIADLFHASRTALGGFTGWYLGPARTFDLSLLLVQRRRVHAAGTGSSRTWEDDPQRDPCISRSSGRIRNVPVSAGGMGFHGSGHLVHMAACTADA